MNSHTLLFSLTASTFLTVNASAQTVVPFGMPASYGGASGTSSNRLITADVTGDGLPDLITTSGPGGLTLVRNAGGGSFLPDERLNAGGLYSGTFFGVDYDSDGDLDILAGEYDDATRTGAATNGEVVAYQNDGTGQFTRLSLIGGLTSSAAGFVMGDLNGDGRQDLILKSSATTLAYRLALGGGGFAPAVIIDSTFTNLGTMFVADKDGDGDQDLIVGDFVINQLRIFNNDGAANFAPQPAITVAASSTLREVVDITGDSRPDLVVVEGSGTLEAALYAQQSDGSFGTRTVLPLGSNVHNVAAGDVNKDGIPDLAKGAYLSTMYSLHLHLGTGGGAFGPAQIIQDSIWLPYTIRLVDLDADTNLDVAVGVSSAPNPVSVLFNKTGEDPVMLLPPASRPHLLGDTISMSVFFGQPISVTGIPRIALQMGGNVVHADYVSGSGTSTLLFRYTVKAADLDLDGTQPVSPVIDLNGGTLKDIANANVPPAFPAAAFIGVVVNTVGPLVQGITRLDPTPATAATARFSVLFAESVQGVDATDFDVVMNAGDLAGATVQNVTGSGSTYEVTVSTGTGSGTLALKVKGDASITDTSSDPLASGFEGGQVYTLKRGAPKTIAAIYRDKHADYRPVWNNGEITFSLDADVGAVQPNAPETPSDEVLTYASPTALTPRPAAATFDFIGVPAGASMYLLPSTQKTGVPFLGFSGESVPSGIFARYSPSTFGDSRVTGTNAYMKIQMVAMRSSTGGQMSVYTVSSGVPRVWMATSDGITGTDAFYQTPGGHSHRNVAFSQPGNYEVDVFVSGFRDNNGNTTYEAGRDNYLESGIFTMVFGVDFPGAWRQEKFGSFANSGSGANGSDPDSDGVSNLLELAFGLDPAVSTTTPLALSSGGMVDQRGLPAWVTGSTESGSQHHAVFLRRKDHVAAGLTYAVQTSHNLSQWLTSAVAPQVIGNDGDMEIVRVQIPAPAEGETNQFMRVNVTAAP